MYVSNLHLPLQPIFLFIKSGNGIETGKEHVFF